MLLKVVKRFERNNHINCPMIKEALPQLKFGGEDGGGRLGGI